MKNNIKLLIFLVCFTLIRAQIESDEQFVAVHVNQMGVDMLNPNETFAEEIVQPFIPNHFTFQYALNLTREIVNGFKYEIIFVMKNEHDEDIYCEMDVLEKPWLTKDNKKYRKMVYNNCSLVNSVDDEERTKFEYDINPIYVNQRSEMSSDEIRLMEDEIITEKSQEDETVVTEQTTTIVLEDATLSALDPSSKNILDNFFNMNHYFPHTTASTTTTASTLDNIDMKIIDEMLESRKIEDSQAQQTHESSTNINIETTTQLDAEALLNERRRNSKALKELEVEIKKTFSELFQTDPEFQTNIIALINRKDDSNVQVNYNYVVNILANKLKDKIEAYNERRNNESLANRRKRAIDSHENSNSNTGSYFRPQGLPGGISPISVNDEEVKLFVKEAVDEVNVKEEPDYVIKKIISASSQIVQGIRYRIKVLIEYGGEDVTCDLDIWEQSWIVDGREVKIICDNMKLYKFNQNPVYQRQKSRNRRQIPGAPSSIDSDDDQVDLFLREAVDEVNGQEDPDYSIVRVISATSQVVAGLKYKIKAELLVGESNVICDFEVWERAWIKDGRQVKIDCDNQKLYSFKQNPVSQRGRKTIVGGPSEVSSDDEDAIKLLNEHITRLDSGSDSPLEVVRIDKVSKQVVAGIKYNIKGVFKAGSDEKTCSVSIWHRAWIKTDDGTKIEANCEDGAKLKQKSRSKRSAHHHHNHRPLHDHTDHHERHHHASTTEQVNEVKAEYLFEEFTKKYNRRYGNDLEHKQRMRIFKKNLHKIEMLNKHEQGTAKYGITEFTDMTEKEYLRKTGLLGKRRHDNDLNNPMANIPDVELPTEFDWRDKSAITAVKNQGNCGSCWSFSVTGNIEGLHAIKTGKLEAYSEQELLDCDTTDNACNGGYMDDAFKAIEKIGGLELEDEYPYQAKKQKKCLFNQTMSHVQVKGVVDLPKDEVAMQKFLVSTGPISIGINANAMQFYRGGVSHPWKVLCRKSNLDHGVLIVGYGIKEYPMFNKTLPYWTIKNSWGPKWGEQGYYRVYRGDNTCGVSEMASSAVLE
ncbi:hypothetical protein ACKWTF_001228 [Chironomus riparius]